MLDIFRMAVDNQVALLNDHLLALETCSLANADNSSPKRLESLMRAAHSIKGAARIVNLDLAVNLAHAMEDCFVAAQSGQIIIGPFHIDVLLGGVDWFTQLRQIPEVELSQWLEQQIPVVAGVVTAIANLVSTHSAQSSHTASTYTNGHSNGRSCGHEDEPESNLITSHQAHPQDHRVQQKNDRVVRINADNLKQLMALAGESLVEVNWLQPFTDAMLHLKRQQQTLLRRLDHLQQEMADYPVGQHHLAEAKKNARDCHALLSDRLSDLDQFSRRFSQLSDNLYREVVASHMRPFADGVQGFPRMVRDLAKQLGKQAQLAVMGQGTPVDRDILERLEAPLIHMLRNAIAHGIETPEQRRALGKPEIGTIHLEATHRAGMLSITVSDDGCGIEIETLRQQVIQKKLTTADMAAQLSEPELMDFLFLPGFSTAQQITEIAGRGVGLDIAQSMVQEVGGLLRAFSYPGQGMKFHFQLPLTLSVIRALLVDIAGEPYAFGLTHIDRVLTVQREEINFCENQPYIVLDGHNISLVRAQQVLGLPDVSLNNSSILSVVILSDQTHRYGLVVDRFLGERDLVVRPLDPRLGKVQDISAAAVTEDGHPLLIIDVSDLVCSIDQLISGGNLSLNRSQSAEGDRVQQKRVLIVDDSMTVREMERKLLNNHGYQVDVTVNGMEGWNAIRAGNYDLVISDVDMPRMNGLELVQHIKSHPKFKSVPVIIVSYKDRRDDQLAGLHAGADYYLTKSSFHDNSLITAVIDLIGE